MIQGRALLLRFKDLKPFVNQYFCALGFGRQIGTGLRQKVVTCDAGCNHTESKNIRTRRLRITDAPSDAARAASILVSCVSAIKCQIFLKIILNGMMKVLRVGCENSGRYKNNCFGFIFVPAT